MLEKFHDFLDQGAMGLSLGFAYPPGCYADTGEVMPLAAAAAERDVIITSHIRNEGNTLFESVEEFIALAEREACRIQISHIKAMWKHNWDKVQAIAEYIQKKRENGIDVTADRYPYTAASTGLDHLLPDSFYEGGDEKEYARLEDPALLKKAEKKICSLYGPDIFDYVQVVGVPGIHNENEYAGRRISAIAQDMDRSPFETYIHLIRAGKLRGAAVYYGMSEHNLELFLSQTFVGVGSDARYRSVEGISSSGTVHPRAYGTFSRFLGRYVREKGLLTLEEALSRITAFPAERFNINKRGYLKKGYRADITIFDPERIRDTATFENPHRYSQGVEYVIINGTVAKKRAELVSHTAGRVVRG